MMRQLAQTILIAKMKKVTQMRLPHGRQQYLRAHIQQRRGWGAEGQADNVYRGEELMVARKMGLQKHHSTGMFNRVMVASTPNTEEHAGSAICAIGREHHNTMDVLPMELLIVLATTIVTIMCLQLRLQMGKDVQHDEDALG